MQVRDSWIGRWRSMRKPDFPRDAVTAIAMKDARGPDRRIMAETPA